jgi:hypothetical protein
MNWFRMHSWHPVAVHRPLVALVLAAAFDLASLRNRSVRWRDAATVLWWLGLLGAATAVVTGLIAYDRVEHSDLGPAGPSWACELIESPAVSRSRGTPPKFIRFARIAMGAPPSRSTRMGTSGSVKRPIWSPWAGRSGTNWFAASGTGRWPNCPE